MNDNNQNNNNQDPNQFTNEELQRLLNDNSQPTQQGGHQPQPQPNQPTSSERTMAGIALAFGILAMSIPVPVLDIILGGVGLILAILARRRISFGLATAGLVLSIIGLLVAITFTYDYFTGGGWFDLIASYFSLVL